MQSNFTLFSSRHLLNIYRRLRNSALSRNKDTSEEALNEFIEILEEAIPSTDEGMGMYNTYRTLYKRNGRSFLNLLDKAGMRYLILWTDARLIHREFDLPKGVYLYWQDGNYLLEFHRDETLSKRTLEKRKSQKINNSPISGEHEVRQIQTELDQTNGNVIVENDDATVPESGDWFDG